MKLFLILWPLPEYKKNAHGNICGWLFCLLWLTKGCGQTTRTVVMAKFTATGNIGNRRRKKSFVVSFLHAKVTFPMSPRDAGKRGGNTLFFIIICSWSYSWQCMWEDKPSMKSNWPPRQDCLKTQKSGEKNAGAFRSRWALWPASSESGRSSTMWNKILWSDETFFLCVNFRCHVWRKPEGAF